MNHQNKYPQVNWIDGMKLNKDNFIALQNAQIAASLDITSAFASPIQYGLIPSKDNFKIQIAADNQQTVRVSITNCTALTRGGVLICIENGLDDNGLTSSILSLPISSSETIFWLVLLVNPFETIPFGTPDPEEEPLRHPYLKSSCRIEIVAQSQYAQYEHHPYALTIGKINTDGSFVHVEEDYIPPCKSVNASQDLIALHAELDIFYANLEQMCANIVQKIYKKSQQNELSQLVSFLCERVILCLAPIITHTRWQALYETPAGLIEQVANLGRSMQNTISLRNGSGKDELLNYISEWSELSQGEFESMLYTIAEIKYNHNDINTNIKSVIHFVKTTSKLFQTLSNLEFIGKRKDTGIFIKEEQQPEITNKEQPKPRRRFFG